MESFSQRCCRVLDRTFGQGQTLQPGPHGIPSNRILVEFGLPAPGPALSYLILLLFFCPLSATEPKATWTSVCNTMG